MIWIGDISHGREIAHAAGTGFDPDIDRVISRVGPHNELLGGVTYSNYTGVAIQMHMAGFVANWATPELTWVCFDYPFMQLKVEQVTALVPSTNPLALDIDHRLGFRELVRLPGVVKDGDLIVLWMTRAECKWLKLGVRYNRAPREMAA